MKRLPILFCLLFCAAAFACAQPIKQTINSNWDFFKGDITNFPAQKPTDIKWEKVSLPHSWNVSDVTDDEPGYYQGVGWYKKTIYTPASYKNKSVYLYFEGANQVTEVYVNGKFAGKHIGGYTAFSFPISQFLNFDAEHLSANEITIKVDNTHSENVPPLNADFTFFGGIYRDVYLLAAEPVHFNLDNNAASGIKIKTPRVNDHEANVVINGSVINTLTVKQTVRVISSIISADGKLIKEIQTKITLASKSTMDFYQDFGILTAPHLWSPDDPYLYHVVNRIVDAKGNTLDETMHPLGLRWFSFDAAKGFYLNGKSIKLIGANRHQDYKGMANAVPDAIHENDMALLKAMGANFVRISHYPQDPAVLEACDRLGLLVSIEIPIVNRITQSDEFTTNCLHMQSEMISQNFNHPSIIIWAYMNEVLLVPRYQRDSPEQLKYFSDVAALAQKLDDLTRKEDPSRYTMISCHGDFDRYYKAGITSIPQIIGWNLYYGWYAEGFDGFGKFLDRHHEVLPDKPVIVTEYGCDGDTRLHSFDPERFDKTVEYETIYHKRYLKDMMERPFVSGGALWCLVDFSSEARIDAAPHVNTKGMATSERVPKDVYYYYQANLLKRPFIKIGSHNWSLRGGVEDKNGVCTQPVEVYSNLPEVSLWLDGKLIDKQPVHDKVAVFNVPFKNGTDVLKASSSVNNSNYEDLITVNFQMQPHELQNAVLPFKEINISLGDKRFFIDDKLQQVWLPEQPYSLGGWGYVGGHVFSMKGSSLQKYGTNKDIWGTDYDPVYATQRVGLSDFKLDVPDGKYEVSLLFAELLSKKEREELPYNLTNSTQKDDVAERNFDILINGKKVIESLGSDNYLEPLRAFSTKVMINVTDGKGIDINFKPIKGEAILNGLQVKKIF
ncbi:MAG TPA: glycoside hydrolase family 2 TIM barrel-domain containing protein [Mucilaginibacter sp.]|nr:glycoside hydrolase family 2 TIM barrel-domain containing protein [Mucilaginibacter sp.]